MQQYLDLVHHVLEHGERRANRTGTDTIGVFGYQMRFLLSKGFPLLTTKKLHWKSIVYELLWFLQGNTNIRYLNEHGVRIWNEWADADGELGPIYGKQWRSWETPKGETIDQIENLIKMLRTDPLSRRLIVSAWNVGELDLMSLPPCHLLFQFYVTNNQLSCLLYQRSADIFLGVPFNIASYALLTHLVAATVGLQVGEFIHTLGDAHIYMNHIEAMHEQISRSPYTLPELNILQTHDRLEAYDYTDIELLNYKAHPHIAGSVAV
ncbi:MAG: thymidylate synthase [Bacteroides sp.]